jgi:lycopene beta-cyclase
MASTKQYDYIFAGGGLSGLTAAVEMQRHAYFQGKTVLMIDRAPKSDHDRTWCYWEQQPTADHTNEPQPSNRWQKFSFHAKATGAIPQLNTDTYQYAMLRSGDFYAWAWQQLAAHPNVERLHAEITEIQAETGIVRTKSGDFQAKWVLNSALMSLPWLPTTAPEIGWAGIFSEGQGVRDGVSNAHVGTRLLQHFEGWFVETPNAAFEPEQMMLMDYRTAQHGDTRFVYVLPLSDRTALVEFTVFSKALLSSRDDYRAALETYLTEQLHLTEYTILEKEFGIIPMADFVPLPRPHGRMLFIGTMGGTVKASSGYGFKSTRRRMKAWVAYWASSGQPDMRLLRSAWRFRWYDRILLKVLEKEYMTGEEVFGALFRNVPAHVVFRFLDEESSLLQDLRIILALPPLPFLRALFAILRGK